MDIPLSAWITGTLIVVAIAMKLFEVWVTRRARRHWREEAARLGKIAGEEPRKLNDSQ